jgi:hypothetical protein
LRYHPFTALQGKDHPFISDDNTNLLVPLPYAFLIGKIQRLSRFQAARCFSNGSLYVIQLSSRTQTRWQTCLPHKQDHHYWLDAVITLGVVAIMLVIVIAMIVPLVQHRSQFFEKVGNKTFDGSAVWQGLASLRGHPLPAWWRG